MEVTTLEDADEIETINTSAGRANREQWWLLWQKRNPTWVYLNDCYQLAML